MSEEGMIRASWPISTQATTWTSRSVNKLWTVILVLLSLASLHLDPFQLNMDKFVSDEQTKMIFDYADPDGSGQIDFKVSA